jgi:hypothetical protein
MHFFSSSFNPHHHSMDEAIWQSVAAVVVVVEMQRKAKARSWVKKLMHTLLNHGPTHRRTQDPPAGQERSNWVR